MSELSELGVCRLYSNIILFSNFKTESSFLSTVCMYPPPLPPQPCYDAANLPPPAAQNPPQCPSPSRYSASLVVTTERTPSPLQRPPPFSAEESSKVGITIATIQNSSTRGWSKQQEQTSVTGSRCWIWRGNGCTVGMHSDPH